MRASRHTVTQTNKPLRTGACFQDCFACGELMTRELCQSCALKMMVRFSLKVSLPAAVYVTNSARGRLPCSTLTMQPVMSLIILIDKRFGCGVVTNVSMSFHRLKLNQYGDQ